MTGPRVPRRGCRVPDGGFGLARAPGATCRVEGGLLSSVSVSPSVWTCPLDAGSPGRPGGCGSVSLQELPEPPAPRHPRDGTGSSESCIPWEPVHVSLVSAASPAAAALSVRGDSAEQSRVAEGDSSAGGALVIAVIELSEAVFCQNVVDFKEHCVH